MYVAFHCAAMDLMFQKIDNPKIKISEKVAQRLQDTYLMFYNDVSDAEWEEINAKIQTEFRNYDFKIKNPSGEHVSGGTRVKLKAAAPPVVLTEEDMDRIIADAPAKKSIVKKEELSVQK